MIPAIPALIVLHAGCAALYAGLATLIMLRHQQSRAGVWLAGACVVTAAWAATVALSWDNPLGGLAGWLELARSAAWYGFIFHLYRRSVTAHRQLMQAFTTMGLMALLLVGGLPLIDVVSNQPGASLWSIGIAIRLGFAVCSILLIENLYFNTPSDLRWHINLLCVALGGLFLYDLVLYADALLFRRVSVPLFEGRASATALAAPLIAIAAARNRRWAIDLHVSRDVVFHSATLVVSGIFLLGLAITGEVFRRSGAEWGYVAEVIEPCARTSSCSSSRERGLRPGARPVTSATTLATASVASSSDRSSLRKTSSAIPRFIETVRERRFARSPSSRNE